MAEVFVKTFDTDWGRLRTAATAKGLALIMLPGESQAAFRKALLEFSSGGEVGEGGKINRSAELQIKQYLQGKKREFSLPLDLRGTPFQKSVLKLVAAIPYGCTATYGEIARAVGQPGAARAVGSANARNRLPIVIPCHRVVATGGLGGYGGGLMLKKKLLILEGAL